MCYNRVPLLARDPFRYFLHPFISLHRVYATLATSVPCPLEWRIHEGVRIVNRSQCRDGNRYTWRRNELTFIERDFIRLRHVFALSR